MVYLQAGQQLQLSPGLPVCCSHHHRYPLLTSPPDEQTDKEGFLPCRRCPILTYHPY